MSLTYGNWQLYINKQQNILFLCAEIKYMSTTILWVEKFTKLNHYPTSLIHITFIENGPIVFETMKDEQTKFIFMCYRSYIYCYYNSINYLINICILYYIHSPMFSKLVYRYNRALKKMYPRASINIVPSQCIINT